MRAISDGVVVTREVKVAQQGVKNKVLNPPYPTYSELLLSCVPEMDPDWLTRLLEKRAAKSCEKT